MNWDQIEGKWKQYTGSVKERWGKLTDDDVTLIRGKRDQLIGVIQERYGIAREEAEAEVNDFSRSLGIGAGATDPDATPTAHVRARRVGD